MFSGPPAKKKVVSFTTPVELTIVTWNVWFDHAEYRRRMTFILDYTLNLNPDIICFQEVLKDFVDIILLHPQIIQSYSVSPFTSQSYGVLTLVKKQYQPTFKTIPFRSYMSRELLKTTLEINQNIITIGNVHLESLNSQKLREEQLQICAKELAKNPIAFLVGDFNFCSERNFQEIPGVPLENDVLQRTIPDFHDLWKVYVQSPSFISNQQEQQVQKQEREGEGEQQQIKQEVEGEVQEQIQENQNDVSTPKKVNNSKNDKIGYTFDSEANPMILQVERMRYDRIMAKFSSDFQIIKMDILGKDPIDPNLIIMQRGQPSTGLWPSDHFGLIATVRTSASLNLSVDSKQGNQDEPKPTQNRPPNPFMSADSRPQLRHVDGIVVTQRDGSRILEKIDRENGSINQESLSSVGVNCLSCGKDIGFQLLGQHALCDICKTKNIISDSLLSTQYLPFSEIEERIQSILSRAISLPIPLRLLAIDYDATLCQVHTYGRWPGTASSLSAHTRPVFRALLKIAHTFPSLRVGIVTFSGQSKLIREILKECLGPAGAERVFIRGADRSWEIPTTALSLEGKQPHIASIIQELYFETGEQILPQQVVLIDDDRRNIDLAKRFSHKTVLFPPLPLPGIHMKSQPEADGIKVLKRYSLLYGVTLCISEGSIVNFKGYQRGAIVNAANTGGITGGGVDGAITMAGGEKLFEARKALPIIQGTRSDRIPCGECRVSGPDQFGSLMVSTVIHAVGPNYSLIEGLSFGRGENVEEALNRADGLLASAYLSCMKVARERNIELLGFSLLSAGAFRGSRSLEHVLRIGIDSISSAVYEGLREVHLVAYTAEEVNAIFKILEGESGPIPSAILIGSGSADIIRGFINDLESSITEIN